MIILIAAIDAKGAIGRDNKLPWQLKTDLKIFKETTVGATVVMGRKTFESIGKPLPGRKNVVLTRDHTYISSPGCAVMNSVNDVLRLARHSTIYVIGGGEIYRQFMSYADRMRITHVEADVGGDTYFPKILPTTWRKETMRAYSADENNDYSFLLVDYCRI